MQSPPITHNAHLSDWCDIFLVVLNSDKGRK